MTLTDQQITRPEDRALKMAITRALDAYADTGRTGIAAAIILDGNVVSVAENRVHQDGSPTRHAEIVALDKATGVLSTGELREATLVSTLQPCEMCLSAIRFSGIKRIVFAARKQNVAGKYFVFPGLEIEDFQTAGPPFSYAGGLREEEVIHLYEDGEE